MNALENPELTPMELKEALNKQGKALRKIEKHLNKVLKIYQEEVLPGSIVYDTSKRAVRKVQGFVMEQLDEVLTENIQLHKQFPETKVSLKDKLTNILKDLPASAGAATRN